MQRYIHRPRIGACRIGFLNVMGDGDQKKPKMVMSKMNYLRDYQFQNLWEFNFLNSIFMIIIYLHTFPFFGFRHSVTRAS